MYIDSLLRGSTLFGIQGVAVDAFSTCFSKPSLNPKDRTFEELLARGFKVTMDSDAPRPYWKSYDKFLDLDYRGQITNLVRWRMMFHELGLTWDDDLFPVLNMIEYDEHARGVRPYEGALQAVMAMRKVRGLTTALCTTASETGWYFEEVYGLPAYFKTIVTSRDYHRDKNVPSGGTVDDTLFAVLPRAMGLEPSQIVVIDDNPEYLSICKQLGFETWLPYHGEVIAKYQEGMEHDADIDIIAPISAYRRVLPQFASL